MRRLLQIAYLPRQARSAVKKIMCKLRRPHTIGRYTIHLPMDSRILSYKRAYHLYDSALADIARAVRAKYPNLHAIDIGANVGDTAALIRRYSEIPVLCIEGDPLLFPILTENAAILGPEVTIERSFVGLDGQAVDPSLIGDLGRTASLVAATKQEGTIKLRSLESILKDHPTFRSAKLLKTDAEGYDFDILRQSSELIRNSKPVIFFEYDPHFRPTEPNAGLATMNMLTEAGYSDFIYYDNFGNFLVHVKAEHLSVLSDLHNYLASNRAFGIAIYYFDVCAFHREDADLAIAVRSSSLATLKSQGLLKCKCTF